MFYIKDGDMKVTSVSIVDINNVPVTDQGKQVYEALLSTGARTTEGLAQHLDMREELIDLMLAHLLRFDVIKIECKWERVVYD